MKTPRRLLRVSALLSAALGVACSCAFDTTLRAYLDAHFWLPFSKQPWHFERKNVRRISAPFAGMAEAGGDTPLATLRAAYQQIARPDFDASPTPSDPAVLRDALVAARADKSLSPRESEEVDLLDAKIDMRYGDPGDPADQLLAGARTKLQTFLRSARTSEFRSEARGWIAHIDYLLGDQTAAGKAYLDELNRNGSNLSRETLLNSLRLTYGYDGGPQLANHLGEYFDTPEHAAFAIQLITNPRSDGNGAPDEIYTRIRTLLERHRELLSSNRGSDALAMLGMRTALRMGDVPGALEIAAMVPPGAAIRTDPDFDWMLASARYLSHDFAAAEVPLLALFGSPQASANQKAAAAYGLCGVYSKTRNFVERIRFALWLHNEYPAVAESTGYPAHLSDQSIYWAESGWDLNLLLEYQAPDEALETFPDRYPGMPDLRLVRYALAVRRARENRYEEAARIYGSIHASWRVPRMRQLAALYQEADRTDLDAPGINEAKYKLAAFIADNSDRIYFNDQLWHGLERYALRASNESGFTREEREAEIAAERKFQDDQEELWRTYLILRSVIHDSGKTAQGRQAAQLARTCLRRISDRFGRQADLHAADLELSNWLRR